MEFLRTRRSRPAKLLSAPVPEGAALEAILEAGLRVPDHGKLEPWRLMVLTQPAALADLVAARGAARGLGPDACEKAAVTFAHGPLIVAVIASPKPSEKIPEIEQTLSAGAVCLSLVNAALASGWGACWLTGWAAMDAQVQAELGLGPQEWIAGFIHIGTSTTQPPERPRPDLSAIVTWR